jgi:hypothetical protein
VVSTAKRGLVRDEARPDGSVEKLCNDALYALVVALRSEQPATGAGSSAPSGGPALVAPAQVDAPTPSYSAMPGRQDRNRDVPADRPVPPPAASGGINQGPIQP